MKAHGLLALVLTLSLESVAAEPARLLLSIGSNYGAPDDAVLQFAEDDAQRLRDVMVELGHVDASRAVVLSRATADTVRAELAAFTGRVAELHAQGLQVQVFVFASGHGRQNALRLSGSALAIDELRALTRRTAADLAVTLIDACDSGVATRGSKRAPAYELSAQVPPTRGEVFIASSGRHEPAQEWDVLGGSLFTHHWLTALRGDADADNDGRVSLMEAYTYASRRTVANSVDTGQHPQLDVDLSGPGDVSLTELKQARAQLELPASAEGRFIIVSQPRPDVVTELQKSAGRSVSLAVPAGRYLVRQTRGFTVALQEIELPYGGTAKIDPARFVTRDFSEVALKGGEPVFHPHGVRLWASLESPPIADTPVRFAVRADYRLTLGNVWFAAGLGYGHRSFRADGVSVFDRRFSTRVAAGLRWWLGPVSLMPGLALQGQWVRQSYTRDDETVIRRSYPGLAVAQVPGASAGALVALEVPLVGPLFAAAELDVWARMLPVEGQPAITPGVDAAFGLGARF